MHFLFCTFFAGFGSAKIIEFGVRFDRVADTLYTAVFYEPRQKCTF